MLVAWLGACAGALVWLWLRTVRLTVLESELLRDPAIRARPWILCFHHGRQFLLLGWRRPRPTVVMVSHSRDGSIQARALSILGFDVVRGSTSRGGSRGLVSLIRRLRADRTRYDAAFAIDGPRGPIGVAKQGAITAARRVDGVLVPMGSAGRRERILERAWDRFALPLPWSGACVVLGPPIDPHSAGAKESLESAIFAANDQASQRLIFEEERRGRLRA